MKLHSKIYMQNSISVARSTDWRSAWENTDQAVSCVRLPKSWLLRDCRAAEKNKLRSSQKWRPNDEQNCQRWNMIYTASRVDLARAWQEWFVEEQRQRRKHHKLVACCCKLECHCCRCRFSRRRHIFTVLLLPATGSTGSLLYDSLQLHWNHSHSRLLLSAVHETKVVYCAPAP